MRALRIPVTRFVLAAALLVGCAAGLSKPAHAERDKSWDRSDERRDERRGARHHPGRHHFDEHQHYSRHHNHKPKRYGHPHFDKHQRYSRRHDDEHPRYGRFDGHGFHALPPLIGFQSYDGPTFQGSIVIRSAPERLVLAAPLPPPPRIIVPQDYYGVTELGRVR